MAISKVTLNGDTLMDVTQDTVTANNLLSGETATGADGVRLTGTLVPSAQPVLQEKTVTPTTSTQVVVADTPEPINTGDFSQSGAPTYNTPTTTGYYTFPMDLSDIESGESYHVTGSCTYASYASNGIATSYAVDDDWIAGDAVPIGITGVTMTWNTTGLTVTMPTAHSNRDYNIRFAGNLSFVAKEGGYDGLSQVTVNPIPSQYIVPSGTKTITENGTGIDVAAYANVDVNVSGGGGGGSASDDVIFIDYDGTIVDSYSAADFANLSALPSNPSHSGLTAQGWNWSLSDAKTYVAKYGQLVIGQMYITDDGKTRIYIHLEEGRTSPMLGCCPNGTVVVDWGDGSATDTLTGTSTSVAQWTPTHNYASAGDYTITLTVTGSMAFVGNSSSNAYSCVLRHTSAVDARNLVYQNGVVSLEIGSGVTNIDNYAFASCLSLSGVSIPESVTRIGSRAFYDCRALLGMVVPNGATISGDTVFSRCRSLLHISIPNSVTSIGVSEFEYCNSLLRVSIPESVTRIYSSAFKDCGKLTSVTIPDSAVDIGDYIFNNCYSLSSISIPDGTTTINGHLFDKCYSLLRVSIPNSVTSIGDSAFVNCYSLPSIIIPDSVTSIGRNAFANCFSLLSANIPSGVTSISYGEFNYCYSLTSIIIPDNITSISDFAFCYCSSLSSVSIPEGVTSIGASAFYQCSSLRSVSIPEGVTSIGNNAFSGCYSLLGIDIPDGVTSIGTYAFSGCAAIPNINVPDGITSVGDGTFSGCSSSHSIIIPYGVTSIGSTAFSNNSGLAEIHFLPTTPPTVSNANAWTNLPADCKIYVPVGTLSAYTSAANYPSSSTYTYIEE